MQIVLSIILPIWALVFSLKRNWIDGNESEIEFLLSKIIEGSIEAIIIVILFIVLFGVTIYNLLNYIRNKQYEIYFLKLQLNYFKTSF